MDSPALARLARPCLLVLLCMIFFSVDLFSAEQGRGFGGIGLQVVPTAGGELVVLKVVEGTPAQEKGVRPGDFIFEVDGHSLSGRDFTEVAATLLWGRVGEPVTIRYLRPGVDGERAVTLERVELQKEAEPTPGVRMLNSEE